MARELEIAGLAAADGLVGPRPAAAGAGPKHAAAHTECLNCGAALHGRYCADCGQADDDHHRSIFHLMWEAVEGLTHLDGRLARTLPPLFLSPGKLARDHFEGRRQRHVPPFRLFLITLLVFMFSLELVFHHAKFARGLEMGAQPARLGQTFTVTGPNGRAKLLRAPTAEEIAAYTGGKVSPDEVARRADAARLAAVRHARHDDDDDDTPKGPGGPADGAKAGARGGASAKAALPGVNVSASVDRGDEGGDRAGSWILDKIVKVRENPELFKSLAFEWGHRIAILLLPIFALLLTMCYFYKRKFYVYDHLVVAMHYLSFVFLLWAVAYLTPKPAQGVVMAIAFFWTPINLYMTLRGAYGSGRIGAGVKAMGLWVATQALFLSVLVGVLVVAIGQL